MICQCLADKVKAYLSSCHWKIGITCSTSSNNCLLSLYLQIMIIVQNLDTYQGNRWGDLRSTGCPRRKTRHALVVDEQAWGHGRQGPFAWVNEIRLRGGHFKSIFNARSWKVIHLVVVDYAGACGTIFSAKASKKRKQVYDASLASNHFILKFKNYIVTTKNVWVRLV